MAQEIQLSLTVHSVIDNLSDSGLPDGDPEISIFTTDGTLLIAEKGIKLAFTERSESDSSTSTLFVKDGDVRLFKRGAIEVDMHFSEGETSRTLYRVGPYTFDMDISTKKIRCSLDERGGELQLIYSMNVGGQEKNVRMKITAKGKR